MLVVLVEKKITKNLVQKGIVTADKQESLWVLAFRRKIVIKVSFSLRRKSSGKGKITRVEKNGLTLEIYSKLRNK